MKKNISPHNKSVKYPLEDAKLKDANQVAYVANNADNDKDVRSHGSRPNHINRPEIKGHSAGKARL